MPVALLPPDSYKIGERYVVGFAAKDEAGDTIVTGTITVAVSG